MHEFFISMFLRFLEKIHEKMAIFSASNKSTTISLLGEWNPDCDCDQF